MRNLLKSFTVAIAAAMLALCAAQTSFAGMIVTQSVTGSSGDYTVEFFVKNELGPGGGVYFFGVALDTGRDIVASPGTFNPDTWPSWDNTLLGGSSTVYNNNWITGNHLEVPDGATQGGFKVHTTAAVAPSSISWFA